MELEIKGNYIYQKEEQQEKGQAQKKNTKKYVEILELLKPAPLPLPYLTISSPSNLKKCNYRNEITKQLELNPDIFFRLS